MDMTEIGRRIRTARGTRTQKQIAEAADFPASTISAWEMGNGNISIIDLLKLQAALGVPLADLLPGTPDAPVRDLKGAAKEDADALFALLVQIHELAPSASPNIFKVIHPSAEKAMAYLKSLKKQPMVVAPVVDQPKPGRQELTVFSLADGRSAAGKVHHMLTNLAAGQGGELELVDRACHVVEFGNRDDISILEVRGESMVNTLQHGDRIVVQNVPAIELAKLTKSEGKRDVSAVRALVPDRCLAICDLNDGGLMVKRPVYMINGGRDWQMTLGADNGDWALSHGYPRVVTRRDRLVIYGKVLGLAR